MSRQTCLPEAPVASEGLTAVRHAVDTLYWCVTTLGQPKVNWATFRSVMIKDFGCDAGALDALAALGNIVHIWDDRFRLDYPPIGWAA